MGRFTQMDPSRQERNAYLYSAGNPVNYADPNGLCASPATDSQAEEYTKCVRAARYLEQQYGIVIYWPGRDHISDILAQHDITTNFCAETAETRTASTIPFHTWTLYQLNDIQKALNLMSSALGTSGVRDLISGGVFVRINLPGAIGEYCYSGQCRHGLSNFPYNFRFSGSKYALVLSDVWKNQSKLARIHTVMHELGHRAEDMLNQTRSQDNRVEWDLWLRFNDFPSGGATIGPTDYARTASQREFLAETFAVYMWENAGTRPPDEWPSTGYVPLTHIPDKSPDKRNLKYRAYHLLILPLKK